MIFIDKGTIYYSLQADALKARRKGDRIYYSSDLKAYYIVRPWRRGWFKSGYVKV